MKTRWSLFVSSASLLLMSHISALAVVTESTTTSRDGTVRERDDDVTVSTVSADVRTYNVTVSAPSPPVYSTGVLSASEFHRIWKIQSWLLLSVEPVALVLLVLSAVAFLQDRQFASNCYLAAICLFEAWYMLMLFVHYICTQQPQCWVSWTYVQISVWSVSYTAQSARRIVYTLSGLLSFQRYVAVAFPLQIRSIRWLQRPLIPLVSLTLLSFLLHLYRPLQYSPVLIKDGEKERWTQGFSPLFRAHEDVFLAMAEICKYLAIYIPVLLCLLSNSLMIVSLRRHKKNLNRMNHARVDQEQGSAKDKAERQMTATILISTFLMVLLNSPININEAVSMYSDYYGMFKKDHYLYLAMRRFFAIVSQVCDILVTLTFFIMGTTFRRRFLALFRPVRHLVRCHRSAAHTASDTSAAAVTSITTSTSLTRPPAATE